MTQIPTAVSSPSSSELPRLIREGAELKHRIQADSERLRLLHEAMLEHASFPAEKNTAHLFGAGYQVSIQRRSSIRWDQRILEQVRRDMGDNAFLKLFAWEFRPRSAHMLNGFLAFGPAEQSSRIRAAQRVSPSAPLVNYIPLERG